MEVQDVPCRQKQRLFQQFKSFRLDLLPACFVCHGLPEDHEGDSCRFINHRIVEPVRDNSERSQGAFKISFDFREPVEIHAHPPQVFNRIATPDVILAQMRACAQRLLPILLQEADHVRHPQVIRRHREVGMRAVCDICCTSIFALTWFCTTCGREICSQCKENESPTNPCQSHGRAMLCPTTRFKDAELHDAIKRMMALKPTLPLPDDQPVPEGDSKRAILSMSVARLDESLFERAMAKGEPVIVKDLQHQFQGNWGPEYFVQRFGSQTVAVVDCMTEQQRQSTVAKFFGTFICPDQQQGKILKLKDWPPTRHFRDVCPELYSAFLSGAPFPDYVRPDGIHNLISHFPRNRVIPDLGPKMSSANGSANNNFLHGSTRLHIDVASSANIMLYASDLEDGHSGFALWHIFPASTTPRLRVFMQTDPAVGFNEAGDPIHNHSTYLTPPLLQLLFDKYGIRPYTIHQYPGEAIFIPAGCAHQVSNNTNTIQITSDFLRTGDLLTAHRLAAEFRAQRLSRNWPEDVLQLDLTIWHAWNSLSRLRDASASTPHDRELARMEAKRQKRRARRQAEAILKRPQKQGHDCRCPACPDEGYFNKSGLICHLDTKHAIVIDKKKKNALVKLDLEEFHVRIQERMDM